MSIINYSRNQYQPEILYLPLAHGGFIQLQEGAHVYPNHAAYGLKNSTNPVVRNYLDNGSISVMIDADDNSAPIVNDGTMRTFAPLDNTAYNSFSGKLQYAPINSNRTQVTTAEEILENPEASPELKEELSNLLATEINKDTEIRKSRKQREVVD